MTTEGTAAAQHSADAGRWAAEHAPHLIGRTIAEVEPVVAAAGLRMKVLRPSAVTTLEHRTDRITVSVDEHELVTGLRAG